MVADQTSQPQLPGDLLDGLVGAQVSVAGWGYFVQGAFLELRRPPRARNGNLRFCDESGDGAVIEAEAPGFCPAPSLGENELFTPPRPRAACWNRLKSTQSGRSCRAATGQKRLLKPAKTMRRGGYGGQKGGRANAEPIALPRLTACCREIGRERRSGLA